MTGESTRAVHGPPRRDVEQPALVAPVYRSTAFRFDSAQQMADVFAGTRPGWSYSRSDNPSAQAFADAVADLEGAEAGQPFASGMAAISSTLMALCSSGSHVIAPKQIYGGTWTLLTQQLNRFGVRTTFVDMTDPGQVAAAITPQTAVVWAETLSNPTMTVADLPALKQAGIPLVVDSTFATPSVCRPLEHGADLVLHSATKYIGGHSDATGGAVAGGAELVARIRAVRLDLGGSLAPDEAVMLSRGLQTLPLRMARHCDNANAVAAAMQGHPGVLRVDHPSLPHHAGHTLAQKLFAKGRYGAIVTITTASKEAGMRLLDRLQLIERATSLGGTASKAVHVTTTTHRSLTSEALADGRIEQGAVRVSIGLEDPADLIADLSQALSA